MSSTGGGEGGRGERPPAAEDGSAEAGAGESPELEAAGTVLIENAEGMHARPCHALVSLARQHTAELRVACHGREVSGHSILELMTLAAGCGTELSFRARGPDAARLVERLLAFVRAGFVDRP